MADQLDDRPVFTIVMGCNGAGKSAWKRGNNDRLPDKYFDKDSIADGIGGWDKADARERTDRYVEGQIIEAIRERESFGVESTYSGQPGPALVAQAIEAGYRVEGVYIGTESPEINLRRIERRVEHQTGHRVDPKRIPERYAYSLHNLRKTAHEFDELTIADNSAENELGIPEPRTELILDKGRVRYERPDAAPWVRSWKKRFDEAGKSRARTARKAARANDSPGGPSEPTVRPAPAKGASQAAGNGRNHDDIAR